MFPTALGAQTYQLWYFVPFHRAATELAGIVPLANTTTTLIQLTPAAAADLVTVPANLTAFTGSADLTMVYWTPPAVPGAASFNTDFVITYEETSQAAGLGDNVVRVDPHDTMLGIAHFVALNGLMNSADVARLSLQIDEAYFLNNVDARTWFYVQRRRAGYAFPIGVVVYDFDYQAESDGAFGQLGVPQGQPSIGQWLHSAQVSTILSTINIAATATLGATPRITTSIKRLARVRSS